MWKGLESWEIPATEILKENQLWIFFSFVERHWEAIQHKIKILPVIILSACLISTHFLEDFKVSSTSFTCSLIYRFALGIIERGFQPFLEVRALNVIERISFITRNEALSSLWSRIQHSMRRFKCPRNLSKSWSFSLHKNLFRVCEWVCACVCVCARARVRACVRVSALCPLRNPSYDTRFTVKIASTEPNDAKTIAYPQFVSLWKLRILWRRKPTSRYYVA